jgi:O-antigen/teichoic acid export membrane protein
MRLAKLRPESPFHTGLASTFATDVTARLLSAITTVILIRAMPVVAYAFVVVFLAIGQFVGSAATGGLRMRYLRAEAERISRGEDPRVGFSSIAVGGLLLITGVGLVGWLIGTLAGIGSPGERIAFVVTCTVFSAGQAVVDLSTAHYQAGLAFMRGGLVNVARSLGLLLAAAVATVIFSSSGTVTAASLAATSASVGLFVAVRIIRDRGVGLTRFHNARLGFDAEASWLTVYSLVAAGFATVDVFIVAIILSRHDVAAFGAAQRYYAIALGAVPALEAVLRVRTSQRDIVESHELQLATMRGWLKKTMLPAVVLTGVVVLIAPLVIPIIDGGRYPSSVSVFQILVVGALAYYVAMPGLNLLMAQGRYRVLAALFGMAFVTNAVGDFVFGNAIGLVGIATVATAVLVALSIAEVALAIRGTTDRRANADGLGRIVVPNSIPSLRADQ